MEIMMHCNLKAAGRRLPRNCYFRTSVHNSDITVKFKNIEFLKESIHLAIRRRFQLSFFNVQIENLSYFYFRSIVPDFWHVSHNALNNEIFFTKFERGRPICALIT